MSANYVADQNNLLGTDLSRTAVRLAPNAPELYDQQGNLNWENSTWENPLRLLKETYLAKNNNLIASSMLRYIPVSGLEFKLGLGYADNRLDESKVSPSTVFDPAYNLGSEVSFMMLNDARQESWSIEPQISWNKALGEGVLSILAGATFQERNREQLGLYAGGFSSNTLITNLMAARDIIVLGNEKSQYRYGAVFGRLNYAFSEKYFINATGRRDGSSRFGPGNRFANFGAIGAAWLFGNEEWLADKLPVLSLGKLRASYGTTGSDQVGDYQFLDTYMSTGVGYQGIIGLEPVRLYNPDFSWETNTKLEMAMDLGFFKDRVLLNVAHYSNRSSSQLVGIPMPGTTGFPSITSNLNATVQNTGWELEVKGTAVKTKELSWTVSAHVTIPRNKLLSFPNLEGSTYASQYIIGQPLGIRQVYHYTGMDPETGAYQFEDYNGDGIISSAGDRKKTVVTAPDFFGGITNRLTYRNWEMDFLFQFVKQVGTNYAYSGTLPGSFANMPVEVLDSWKGPGDQASVQPYTTGTNSGLMAAFSRHASSDAAFSDASFVRLKNLSLSYTLPISWTQAYRCRLYLQAQNLLTFTKFRGADPENQSSGMLPPLRMITAGVQLDF